MKKMSIYFGVLFLVVVLFSHCAFVPSVVTLNYVPQLNLTKVPGAESVKVNIEIVDSRIDKNVGQSKILPIKASNDVLQVLKKAVETEIMARGFSLGDGITVTVDLRKLFCIFDEEGPFLARKGFARADATMIVRLKKADGSAVLNKEYTDQGKISPIAFMKDKYAQEALDMALKKIVGRMATDNEFIDAILAASSK